MGNIKDKSEKDTQNDENQKLIQANLDYQSENENLKQQILNLK